MRLLPILLCLLTTLAHAESFSGRVVAISDGDTLTVLDSSRRQHKIRLAGIDAPEKAQPFGMRSKQHLSNLLFDKNVEADCVKIDRYQREICKIIVDGVDANLIQVSSGMAWWYRTYAKDQSKSDRAAYTSAEREARDAKRGLWSTPDVIAPWEWRRGREQ